jgi:hypothetical protein
LQTKFDLGRGAGEQLARPALPSLAFALAFASALLFVLANRARESIEVWARSQAGSLCEGGGAWWLVFPEADGSFDWPPGANTRGTVDVRIGHGWKTTCDWIGLGRLTERQSVATSRAVYLHPGVSVVLSTTGDLSVSRGGTLEPVRFVGAPEYREYFDAARVVAGETTTVPRSTVLYAASLGIGMAAAYVGTRQLQRWTSYLVRRERLAREHCPQCDYPLSETATCPECGWRRDA